MLLVYIVLPLLLTSLILLYLSNKKVKELQGNIVKIKEDFEKQRGEIRRDAKKRSGAVQWGNAIENFVPFMDKFPIPAEDCHFFGKPIDFIGFTDINSKDKCTIHIIEVKSGRAMLNRHQVNIKEAVKQKRVEWHDVRVKTNTMK